MNNPSSHAVLLESKFLMPIDELEMAELYVQLFTEKQRSKVSTHGKQTFFQAPADELKISVTSFQSLYPENEDIFSNIAKSFQNQNNAELFSATQKVSNFLNNNHKEISSSLEPEFRVLDYVYPIV